MLEVNFLPLIIFWVELRYTNKRWQMVCF